MEQKIKNQHSPLPSIQEQAYELAYRLACEKLASADIRQICCRTGAQGINSNKILIEYLNRSYLITHPDAEISLTESDEEVPLKDKILILHYLTSTKSTPASNKLITFKQLPGGSSYFPAFSQRAIKPLLNYFSKEPELLIASAVKLGGHKANYGDVSATINAFPRVPIIIALWQGDDEFPPNGSIMFDAKISDYLPVEDICVLCETITWRLIRSLH
jgi:hypothetical protein